MHFYGHTPRTKILTVFRLESGWTRAYSGLMLDVLRRIQGGHGKFDGFCLFVKPEFTLDLTGSGADKSHCQTPGASAFLDRASETSLDACPWASDIS